MADLVRFLLVCYGLAWIVSSAKVSYAFRTWLDKNGFSTTVELLECVGCFGFWEGFIYRLSEIRLDFSPSDLGSAVAAGFLVAGSNMLLNTVIVIGERHA